MNLNALSRPAWAGVPGSAAGMTMAGPGDLSGRLGSSSLLGPGPAGMERLMGKDTRAPRAFQASDDMPPGWLDSQISDPGRFAVLPGRCPGVARLYAGHPCGHAVEGFERSNEIVIKCGGFGWRPELEAVASDQQQRHDDETDCATCQGNGRRDHGTVIVRIVAERLRQQHGLCKPSTPGDLNPECFRPGLA